MMIQARAMLLDAYRELNHKKLFWIVMFLSGIVVAAFGAVGINERGLTVLAWEFPFPLTSLIIPKEIFYKMFFANLGIKWWLGWVASILALVSTAGMFPDFIASGSIELTLSKPIARLRLFLLKYACGLLFVALQVFVFCIASFLVIGLRADAWEPKIFLAIPLTVAIFSFLFCVCVLLGMVTRSAIASLLLTLLFWVAIFGIDMTERVMLMFHERNQLQRETLTKSIASLQERGRKRLETNTPLPAHADPKTGLSDSEQSRLDAQLKRQDRTARNGRTIGYVHSGFLVAKTVLPKTSESANLLDRALLSKADRDRINRHDNNADDNPAFASDDPDERIDEGRLAERLDAKFNSRSVFWVFGTSLLFEAGILGLAAWIFCRRDF